MTTTPSASTNRQNSSDAESTRPRTVTRRRTSPRTASTTVPASAAHTGSMPTSEPTMNPAKVSPSTTRANTGGAVRAASSSTPVPTARSVRNIRRSTAYSMPIVTSQGSAISALNRPNESFDAVKASRFVRFDTGSSSDAELARCVQA